MDETLKGMHILVHASIIVPSDMAAVIDEPFSGKGVGGASGPRSDPFKKDIIENKMQSRRH